MPDPIELIADPSQAIERIEHLPAEIDEALYARLSYLNHLFAERVRANLSGEVLQRRSGRLFDSVAEVGPAATSSDITASVQAGGDEAPYGIVHEEGGDGYYTITPVNRQALAFEANGKTVFAKSVNHPPAAARPWFGIVADEMEQMYAAELQEAMSEVVSR